VVIKSCQKQSDPSSSDRISPWGKSCRLMMDHFVLAEFDHHTIILEWIDNNMQEAMPWSMLGDTTQKI
jgi:hypothetical protein